MNSELRARILAYNKKMADRKEKADDLQLIVDAMMQLPYGQLKKVLTEDVMAVLAKYGILEGKDE